MQAGIGGPLGRSEVPRLREGGTPWRLVATSHRLRPRVRACTRVACLEHCVGVKRSCVQQYFGLPPTACQNMVRVTCMPALAEKREEAVSAFFWSAAFVYVALTSQSTHIAQQVDACVRRVLF